MMTNHDCIKEQLISLKEELQSYFPSDDQYSSIMNQIHVLESELQQTPEVEEYSENIFELATIYPKNRSNYNIVLAINLDTKKIGEPYFKMYKGKSSINSTGVARISFINAKLIKEHTGRIKSLLKLNKDDKEELLSYLKETNKDFPKYTNWDVLKYRWNEEYGFDIGTIDEYMSGKYDNNTAPSFVKSLQHIPDYAQL